MAQTALTEQRAESLLDVEQARPEDQRTTYFRRIQLIVVFVIYVVFRAADRVFYKDLQNELVSTTYQLVWANILWPFAVQILTLGMIGGYVLVQRWQGNTEYNCRFFLPSNPLASSKGAIPMYQLALFVLGDQLNSALGSPPGPFVALPIQNVMSQFVLIWMAIIGYFWIGSRYKQVHFVGMTLVIVAIAVQMAPKIVNNDCSEDGLQNGDCLNSYQSPLDGGKYIAFHQAGIMIFWYALFLVSTAPTAVGNIYKQKVLQGCDADVFYVTFWSGWFQMFWGWICIPLMWIPLPGQQTLTPGETFQAIADTLSCIAGNVPHAGDETCAGSPAAWVWIVWYLGFNLSFNVCFTWLTKRTSAAWAQVGNVLVGNLANIFASLKFIMGSSAKPVTVNQWLGTIVVSVALWVYSLEPEVSNFTAKPDGSITKQGL